MNALPGKLKEYFQAKAHLLLVQKKEKRKENSHLVAQ